MAHGTERMEKIGIEKGVEGFEHGGLRDYCRLGFGATLGTKWFRAFAGMTTDEAQLAFLT
jgi:hypothetical protein